MVRREETLFEVQSCLRVKRQHVVTSDGRNVEDHYQVQMQDFVVICALTDRHAAITL